jgi:4-hydroxy-3-polyprenylbenzoate decarboxylase
MERWVIGVSGASGTVYARRLMQVLLEQVPGVELEVVLSEGALRVMQEEENLLLSPAKLTAHTLLGVESDAVRFHNNRDIGASIASGSYRAKGMVIVPCSMNTLAAVAHGISDNLIRRAADVTLKEGRPLIVVPRETPLSRVHLQNMLELSNAGAKIAPAMPGFYHQPKTVNELVSMMALKITDLMGYHLQLVPRWGEDEQR